ncbi:MAG: FkbM family methyltransferase [Candidatus Bathyarchaeia archaeon]
MFPKDSIKKIGWVQHGDSFSDKIRIASFLLLRFLLGMVRNKVLTIETLISALSLAAINRVRTSIDGIRYDLVDYASFIIVTPEWESSIWNYLKPKPGDTFLDVGAHIGKYSLKVAEMVQDHGMVIAIEPMPRNYSALVSGITSNGFRNVVALNIAAWSRNCMLSLFFGNSSGTHSAKGTFGSPHVEVYAKKMDDIIRRLNIDCVDWIKIDVEGAEFEVLSGLEDTIRNHKPRIIIEVRKENLPKVSSFMGRRDYSMVGIPKLSKASYEYYYCQRAL